MGRGKIVRSTGGGGEPIGDFIPLSQKAVAGGVATLDGTGQVPKTQISLNASDVGAVASETDPTVSTFTKGLTTNDAVLSAVNAATGLISASRLPSYVVLNYANLAAFPASGDTGKIYVAESDNKIYRWSGTAYIEISPTAGNADSATKLATARTISSTGDGSWSVTFDGSANATAGLTLATVNLTPGNFGSATQTPVVTVDAKGRITAVSNTTLTPAWASISGKPTTLAELGVTGIQPLGNELSALQALADSAGFLRKTGDGSYSIDNSTYLTPSGNGSQLTALNASNFASGTVPDARLSSNVGLLTGTQTFSGAKTFSEIVTISNSTPSTSTTTGAEVIAGGLGIGENCNVGGFSSFGGQSSGHPGIKIKQLSGTTASTEGGIASVAHGISFNQIIAVNVLVSNSASSYVAPGYNISVFPGLAFSVSLSSTNIQVINHPTDSENILGKSFIALLFYKA